MTSLFKKKKEGNERKGETGRKEARDGEGESVCVGRLPWHMTSRNVLPGVSMYNLFLFLNREFSELNVFQF